MGKGRVAGGLVQIGAQENAPHTVQAKQLARGLDPRTAARQAHIHQRHVGTVRGRVRDRFGGR